MNKPELTVSAASINNEPIELDSTPLSPDEVRLARRGSKAEALAALDAEKGLSSAEREVSRTAQPGLWIRADCSQRRAKLILERKSNPAVLVDIPQAPAPDQLERSGAGRDEEGSETPKDAGQV